VNSAVQEEALLLEAILIADGQGHAAPKAHLHILKLHAEVSLEELDTAIKERDAALIALRQMAHNEREATTSDFLAFAEFDTGKVTIQ
jgi:hypothetical protein